MQLKLIKILCLTVVLFLSACSMITGIGTDNAPDPTPLSSIKSPLFKPSLLHSQETGVGADDLYYKFSMALVCNQLYIVDAKGHASAIDVKSGKTSWAVATKAHATSGVAAAENTVVFAARGGKIYALDAQNGQTQWVASAPNQVLSTPTIADGKVFVKTVDGELIAFDRQCGKTIWHYEHSTPLYILRDSSAPKLVNNRLIVGFSDGKLAAYQANTGMLLWEQTIATPTGRGLMNQLVDISANPELQQDTVYVVTYQGNIAAVSISSGEIRWEQPLSSYAGMVLTPQAVVVTEADGVVSAYAKSSGKQLWRQTGLQYRTVTGPAWQGDTVVVADKLGYVHWLSLCNGCFVARAKTTNEPILSTPFVNGPFVYVLNQKGKLYIYSIHNES